MPNWMVGIDIGGTFTDVAGVEVDSGTLHIAKVPSIPADPSRAVIAGLESLFERVTTLRAPDVRFFAHGTTVATNALLELKGAKAGLLITRGFDIVYELRGGRRPMQPDLVDTFYQKPPVLVPLRQTEEIGGRMAYDGTELEPLDEDGVRAAVRRLREQGVNSIAVCYLFSFMNPAHEQRTAEIIREEHPNCRISLSSVVLPIIREYQRTSTTVLDAYVGPVIESYLRRLGDRLRETGVHTPQVFIMQSNGGLMRIDIAASYPNQTLLSGPAAGVIFGANMAGVTGQQKVITFDMGGTSTDISVISGGAFEETRQGRIAGQDIGTPMMQIRTLGAGGGTIAWIGPDGLLKAGPQSAGADPGPAAYGKGGTQPTITDANLVLGYLDPDYFVGGSIKIDPRLSEEAIRTKVAEPLGLTLEQAALGIIRVVNVNMEVGLRLSLLERGQDHRQFALVAFGGAGPVHATRVARNVGIPIVVVPTYPGISCAMGLLQTDVKHFYIQTRLGSLASFSLQELNGLFAGLEERARAEAREEGFEPGATELHRQLDMRYPFQGYELTVPCPSESLAEADVAGLRQTFDRLHHQVYGISAPDEMPEIVNVRVMSVSRVPMLRLPELPAGGTSADHALTGRRRALFEEFSEYVDTPVYRRESLQAGNVIEGPAIVEQLDSTTVILPRQQARVDRLGMLIIEVEAAG
jgi:N-methylhydantoinase A